MAPDNFNQLTRSVKNSDAVSETRMRGAGIDQFGKPKLFDAPQSLEFACLYHAPEAKFELLPGLELDEVV